MLQLISQVAANGLMTGLVYILMALGFTLIFGIMRVVNFAHGELYMIGAFAILILFGTLEVNYYLAVVVSVIIAAIFGIIIERTLLRRFVGQELNGMIMALAISISLQALAGIFFGPQEQSVARPISGIFNVGGVIVPRDRIVVGGIALLVLAAFYIFLRYTRYGLAMRAVSQDADAAALQGIRPALIYTMAFGIGSLLAGLAGALMAPIYTIFPYMGSVPMMKAFIVVILGGLGSLPGAVIGGLLLGMVESGVASFYSSTIATMVAFGLVILILLFRPNGLMGRS
ncbi:branched-chain amino acid ABC transporter permease [Pollutimonas sp. H1-120]|uniref:branched-chain amino acid ABC transporter permease n=1 Tax=Pollutimonas sp. H1-120 TaxID=3148824 RepID=UPI003B5198CF